MQYEYFTEIVEQGENGKYVVEVNYCRKGVSFKEQAFVDNASDAHAKLRDFRHQFKVALNGGNNVNVAG